MPTNTNIFSLFDIKHFFRFSTGNTGRDFLTGQTLIGLSGDTVVLPTPQYDFLPNGLAGPLGEDTVLISDATSGFFDNSYEPGSVYLDINSNQFQTDEEPVITFLMKELYTFSIPGPKPLLTVLTQSASGQIFSVGLGMVNGMYYVANGLSEELHFEPRFTSKADTRQSDSVYSQALTPEDPYESCSVRITQRRRKTGSATIEWTPDIEGPMTNVSGVDPDMHRSRHEHIYIEEQHGIGPYNLEVDITRFDTFDPEDGTDAEQLITIMQLQDDGETYQVIRTYTGADVMTETVPLVNPDVVIVYQYGVYTHIQAKFKIVDSIGGMGETVPDKMEIRFYVNGCAGKILELPYDSFTGILIGGSPAFGPSSGIWRGLVNSVAVARNISDRDIYLMQAIMKSPALPTETIDEMLEEPEYKIHTWIDPEIPEMNIRDFWMQSVNASNTVYDIDLGTVRAKNVCKHDGRGLLIQSTKNGIASEPFVKTGGLFYGLWGMSLYPLYETERDKTYEIDDYAFAMSFNVAVGNGIERHEDVERASIFRLGTELCGEEAVSLCLKIENSKMELVVNLVTYVYGEPEAITQAIDISYASMSGFSVYFELTPDTLKVMADGALIYHIPSITVLIEEQYYGDPYGSPVIKKPSRESFLVYNDKIEWFFTEELREESGQGLFTYSPGAICVANIIVHSNAINSGRAVLLGESMKIGATRGNKVKELQDIYPEEMLNNILCGYGVTHLNSTSQPTNTNRRVALDLLPVLYPSYQTVDMPGIPGHKMINVSGLPNKLKSVTATLGRHNGVLLQRVGIPIFLEYSQVSVLICHFKLPLDGGDIVVIANADGTLTVKIYDGAKLKHTSQTVKPDIPLFNTLIMIEASIRPSVLHIEDDGDFLEFTDSVWEVAVMPYVTGAIDETAIITSTVRYHTETDAKYKEIKNSVVSGAVLKLFYSDYVQTLMGANAPASPNALAGDAAFNMLGYKYAYLLDTRICDTGIYSVANGCSKGNLPLSNNALNYSADTTRRDGSFGEELAMGNNYFPDDPALSTEPVSGVNQCIVISELTKYMDPRITIRPIKDYKITAGVFNGVTIAEDILVPLPSPVYGDMKMLRPLVNHDNDFILLNVSSTASMMFLKHSAWKKGYCDTALSNPLRESRYNSMVYDMQSYLGRIAFAMTAPYIEGAGDAAYGTKADHFSVFRGKNMSHYNHLGYISPSVMQKALLGYVNLSQGLPEDIGFLRANRTNGLIRLSLNNTGKFFDASLVSARLSTSIVFNPLWQYVTGSYERVDPLQGIVAPVAPVSLDINGFSEVIVPDECPHGHRRRYQGGGE